jgi:two-component system cell cycle sensor histidine kinase/response regulator CckA
MTWEAVQFGSWMAAGLFLALLVLLVGIYVHRQVGLRDKLAADDIRLRGLLAAMPDTAAFFDAGGQRMERLYTAGSDGPVPAGESVPLEQVFPDDTAHEVRAIIMKTALTNREQILEYPVLTAAGETRWFEGRTGLLGAGRNGLPPGVAWVARDITRHKRLEMEIRASEARYSQLFQASPDALFVATLEGAILTANEQAEVLFCFTSADIQKDLTIAQLYAPSNRALFGEDSERLKQQGRTQADRRFKRLDGTAFTGELIAGLIPYQDNSMVLAAVHDITELRREQERLEQVARMEGLGRFAGVIAHDFNNLLAGILGSLDLLKGRFTAGSQASGCLAVMEKAAARGVELTRKLLRFARRGGRSVALLDLRDTLSEVRDMLRYSMPPEIGLVLVPAPGPLWARGDATELQQMVMNLALNAQDAMPLGGELRLSSGSVRLDAAAAARQPGCPGPGAYAWARVSDTGTGIAPEIRKHLFEPFFTTKKKGEGTGLGLAMVYGGMKEHGGFVEVASETGKGTDVTLYFPEAPPPTASA